MKDFVKESEILKALAHPVRLKIVSGLLCKAECNVTRMVTALGLPQSTVSQHLAILKSKGILKIRKDGVKTCYSIADKRINTILKLLNV